jgi:hypothetical protein
MSLRLPEVRGHQSLLRKAQWHMKWMQTILKNHGNQEVKFSTEKLEENKALNDMIGTGLPMEASNNAALIMFHNFFEVVHINFYIFEYYLLAK